MFVENIQLLQLTVAREHILQRKKINGETSRTTKGCDAYNVCAHIAAHNLRGIVRERIGIYTNLRCTSEFESITVGV